MSCTAPWRPDHPRAWCSRLVTGRRGLRLAGSCLRRRPHSLRRKIAHGGRPHTAESAAERMISCGGRFRSWRRAFLVGKALPRRRVLPAEGFGRGGRKVLVAAESFAPRRASSRWRVRSRRELRAAENFAPRRASLRGAHLPLDTRRPLSSAVSRPRDLVPPDLLSPDLVPRDLVPRDVASCISTSIVARIIATRRPHAPQAVVQWARWWAPAIGARPQGVIPEPTRRACRPCTMALPSRCARQSPHVPLPPVGPLPTPGPAESACRQVGRHIAEHRETRLTPDRSSAAAVSDRSAAAPDPASDQDGRCSRT